MTPRFRDSVTPWFRDFSFFLSSTFVSELILLKIYMNANIVKIQLFYKTKYDLKGNSRSQTTTLLFKNSLFLLFVLLIDWRNKCRWTLSKKFDLYNDDICLVFILTCVLIDSFCPCFLWVFNELQCSGKIAGC